MDPDIFIVEDDASVRRALTRVLRAGGREVATFPDAQAFLDQAPLDGPGCLVTDLRLPGLNGLELQQELRRRGHDLSLVFISGQADVPSAIQALKGGAVDFLQKPIDAAALLSCVERALAGARDRWVDRMGLEELQRRAARLTPREREVFALIVQGLLNKQVGAELGAAEKTIKTHRARVMEKMQAGSLAELVRMADRLGLAARSA